MAIWALTSFWVTNVSLLESRTWWRTSPKGAVVLPGGGWACVRVVAVRRRRRFRRVSMVAVGCGVCRGL